MKRLYFILTVIACAFILSACNNEPSDSPGGGGGLSSARKPRMLYVTNRINLVQQFNDATQAPGLGGWYEKTDAPVSAASLADYIEFDPKNAFTVVKHYDIEDDEPANTDDFAIVVLEDDAVTPKANTKLETIGLTKIRVVYKGDTAVPVSYYDIDGKPLENQNYLEIMVAAATAPEGQTFAGFTIQRLPVKTVYDWKEPFDPSGLAVIKWYNAQTMPDGIPVIAGAADYNIDASAYTSEFAANVHGVVPTAPLDANRTFTVKITEPSGSGTPPAGDPAKEAEFEIKRIPKKYTIQFSSSNGEALSGGSISSSASDNSSSSEFIAGAFVTLRFTKGVNTQLNPESVAINFNGLDVKPVSYEVAGTSQQQQFQWITVVDLTQTTLTASFIMPAANVTVVGDFLFAGTNLRSLAAKREGETDFSPVFGFSPNIRRYEYVIHKNQSTLYLKATSDADITFTVGDSDSPGAQTATVDSTTCEVTNIAAGDTTIVITTTSGSEQGITNVVIKKFGDDNKITYKYTGGVQSFIPPALGQYKFTAWGAYGGNSVDCDSRVVDAAATGRGGIAAWAQGTLVMDPSAAPWNPAAADTTGNANIVYVYVGEGGWGRKGYTAGKATYNGGGAGGAGGAYGAGSSGGGATSVSLTRGAWSDWQVLIDRIMVAGGGGGYSHNKGKGGAGGGLVAQGGCMTGYDTGTINPSDYNDVTKYGPTTFSLGWFTGASQYTGSGRGGQGFGTGGLGPSPPGWGGSGAEGRGGGGGGYFGGEISWGKIGGASNCGGGGGSSYVSGHGGCIAYNSISSPTWLVQIGKSNPSEIHTTITQPISIHYSARVFTETGMTDLTSIGGGLTSDGPNLQGVQSPVQDPFTGGLGPLGAKNRDGILIIEYIQ